MILTLRSIPTLALKLETERFALGGAVFEDSGDLLKSPRAFLLISDLEFGGAQRQVVELANNMPPEEFEVHVCSLAGYVPLAERLRDRSRFHIVRKRHKYDFTVALKLAQLFRQLRTSVVHTFLFDADFFGRLGAALARVPAVIGSERNCFEEVKRRNVIAWRLTQRLVKLTVANSNAGVDFNSRMLRQPRSHYRVVHNGVNTERFYPRDCDQLRAELGIGPSETVAGIFGSFKPQKNHLTFLAAANHIAKSIPSSKFLFVGDELYMGMSNSTEYKRKIHEAVDALGLRSKCIFVGNRPDVERFYNLCDVTVLPSLFEGTPNVALESMASGVPVVASDVSDNAYVIPDTKAGFIVRLGDDIELANRTVAVLTNPDLRGRMSLFARQWVLNEFSCKRLAEKTAIVYREALGSSSRIA